MSISSLWKERDIPQWLTWLILLPKDNSSEKMLETYPSIKKHSQDKEPYR